MATCTKLSVYASRALYYKRSTQTFLGKKMLNKTKNYKIVAIRRNINLTNHLYAMLPLKHKWCSILDYSRLRLTAYNTSTARKWFWEYHD